VPAPSSRRRFVQGGVAALGLAAAGGRRAWSAPAFDLVIRGGSLVDGTGGAPFAADLGLRGDTIAAIGTIGAEQGRDVIDATGLTVTPGFIDIHSHSDGSLLEHPGAASRIRQGITTELTGNCGSSAAPLRGHDLEARRKEWRDEGVEPGWNGVAGFHQQLERTGIALNQALLVGQGTLRSNAVGDVERPLTAEERRELLRALEEALDEGAWGLSTGLEYVPGRYTPPDEIAELCSAVARRGGLYASHVRNEVAAVLEAVDEAIGMGRRTGVRVQVSHVKVTGRANWGKQEALLHLIESARRSGVEVRGDAYPYTAYSTGITVFLSDEVLEGGTGPMLRRLGDESRRPDIVRALAARIAEEPGDATLIVLSSLRSERNRGLAGRTLADVAASRGVSPAEALVRLLVEEQGDVGYIGHAMSEPNVERVLAHPLILVGTDGRSLAPVGRTARTRPHPRSYGACVRVLAHYCRDRRLFDLPTAVRKMTSLPADQIGLRDRGRLAPGQKADLVALDLPHLRDLATFDDPQRHPEGLPHVVVNGVPVVRNAAATGARPGRALRRP
jgi:N-acyl-D-amino-acid deacylase